MRKVRTSMEPDREIEVTEQECTDLRRQGLLAPEPETETPAETEGNYGPGQPRTRTTKPKGDDK